MVHYSSIHVDDRTQIRYQSLTNTSSITIEDTYWKEDTKQVIGFTNSIYFSRSKNTVKVVDELIAALKEARKALLTDCIACQGTGTWEEHEVGWDGEETTVYTPCPECQGEGKVAPSESTAA